MLHHVGIGQAEPHLPGALVEAGFGNHFTKHLPIETERARLLGRERAAELASDLLQALVIDLPELLDRDFGAADLGERRAAITVKNIVDAPDGKAERPAAPRPRP